MKGLHYWSLKDSGSHIPFDPKFRKATPMMRSLVYGLKPIMEAVVADGIDRGEIQVFLGSMHGEIDPTLNFLRGLAEKDWARPFLFQNSLHHSTTGFASQQFQLLGPCYSLCTIENAQTELLEAGISLCQYKQRPGLFIHCEYFPQELQEISKYNAHETCEILFVDSEYLNNKVHNVSSFKEYYAALVNGE